MERRAEPRVPVGTGGGGHQQQGPPVAGIPLRPASGADVNPSQPPGAAVLGAVSPLGRALLFSDGLCPFLGVVLSSSFLSCPSRPRAGCNHRVAVSGGGLVSGPVYREAGPPALPCPTSWLPEHCRTRGARPVTSRAGRLRSCCSQGVRHLPEEAPGAQAPSPLGPCGVAPVQRGPSRSRPCGHAHVSAIAARGCPSLRLSSDSVHVIRC